MDRIIPARDIGHSFVAHLKDLFSFFNLHVGIPEIKETGKKDERKHAERPPTFA